MRTEMHKPIIMTVDLEDWFQVENLRSAYPHDSWNSCDLHVPLNTHVLLDIFDHYGVHATFFVLGWVAERCRGLVREIHTRGHEIASHGYSHRLLFDLPKGQLERELRTSKSLLEDITGAPVRGFRAPGFSVTDELLELLPDLGYEYDSSYNNIFLNKRCGKIDGWRVGPNGALTKGKIVELSIRNLKIGPFTIPWGGGGYFRLFPPALFKRGVERILLEEAPYVFYMHPWELDSVQPRTRGIGRLNGFRHYVHLSDTFHRINYFFSGLKDCSFMGCHRYLHQPSVTPLPLQTAHTIKPAAFREMEDAGPMEQHEIHG